jgi:hypothetical protein
LAPKHQQRRVHEIVRRMAAALVGGLAVIAQALGWDEDVPIRHVAGSMADCLADASHWEGR